MKNTPTKLLSTVLALLMILSSLVTCFALTASAEEASAVPAANVSTNKAYNLTQGIDFENYVNSSTAAEYLRDTAGLWITTQTGTAAKSGLNVVERTNKDGTKNKVLNLTSNAYFINGNVSNAFDQAKYNKSKDFLDLIYGAEGPKNFTISLDMTLNGKSGEMNVGATSDSTDTSYLLTRYRGVSALSFSGYKYVFKATSANLPTYTIDSETGYAKVGTVPEDMKDKGYLYAPTQLTVLKADSAVEGDYWYVSPGKTYPARTDSVIHPDAMKPENRVTYTLGVPFNVRMEFTRVSSSKMNVITFIDNKQLGGVVEYDIGTNTTKNFGFRLFDAAANADIDNIKVGINDLSAADYQIEPVNTPNGFVAKYFAETALTTAAEDYKMRTELGGIEYASGSTIANNISDILNGKTLSLTAPANGSYWLAFDLNTPADYTVAAADLLTIGDKTVLATDESGKLSLLGQTAVGNALTAKNTYNVAMKLDPTATAGTYDVYLYVEGLLADTAKAVAISGSDIVLSANGVNLRNVKAVDKFTTWRPTWSTDISDFDSDKTYVYSVEDYVSAPCVTHTPLDGTYRMYEIPDTSFNGSNDGVWSYICSECGVRVYIEQTPNVKKTFTGSGTTPAFENKFVEFSLQGSRVGVSSGNGFNASKDKYIFSYTLDLNNSSDIITAVAAKGTDGGALIDFCDYKSALRLYSIAKKEDGSCPTLEELQAIASTAAAESKKAVGVSYGVAKDKSYPDAILIAEKISGKEDFPVPYYILELGKQYQITLVGQTGGKTSTEGGIKVYINGELVYDKCQQKITTLSQVRCGDVVLYSYYSDLVVGKYNEYVHTCTDKWSTDCKFTVGDTAVKYTCTCYCGKALEEYITSVVEDDIPYISEGATVSYTAPAGEYLLFTDANIPENTTGTILSLGDTAVLEADSYNGNVAVAVKVNGNAYTLYVDGEKIADGTYTGATAFTFGENATFSYTKLVELGATDTPAVPKVNGSDCEHVDGTPTSRTIVRFDSHTGYRYTCSECGEVAYRSFNHNLVEPKTMTSNNNGASTNLYQDSYYTLKSHNGALFTTTLTVNDFPTTWVADDPGTKNKVDPTNKSLLTWFMTNPDNASTFQQWIRIYYAEPVNEVRRGEVRYYEDGFKALETPIYFEVGGTYEVAVYFDINKGIYDLYIDDKYVVTADGIPVDMGPVNARNEYHQYAIRLGDDRAGKYVGADWRVAIDHEHKHDGTVNSVEYDIYSLEVGRTCTVCGVDYTECVDYAVANNIIDVYDGNETVSFTAPSGEYWLTTEINMRTQQSGNLITLGNDVILTTEDVTITAPDTVQVAICVNGTAYTLYVDGVEHSTGTLSAVPASVTYGQSSFGAYVRFNNNKIAIAKFLVEGKIAKPKQDASVKACAHTHKQGTPIEAINHYAFGFDNVAYICEKCGERVYAELTDSLRLYKYTTYDDDGKPINNTVGTNVQYAYDATGSKFAYLEPHSLSNNATPYWIMFDLNCSGLTAPNGTDTSTSNTNARHWNGWGIITVMPNVDSNYESELRLIPDGWEKGEAIEEVTDGKVTKITKTEGNGYDGIYVLHKNEDGGADFREATKVAEVNAGTKHHFALYIDPTTGDYDVYVDGVYVTSVTDKNAEANYETPVVRVFEGEGLEKNNLAIKNFVVAREAVCYDGTTAVIETTAKFKASETVTEAGTYVSLIDATRVLNGSDRTKDQKAEFLSVDAYTGQFAYLDTTGKYVPLYSRDGTPLLLTEEGKDIAVIFVDTAETLRYYIGGYIPYVPGTEEGTYVMLGTVPVNNATYCDNKGRADSFNVNHDYIDGLKNLSVYTVNDKGIPEVLGYQENSLTDAIRIISGVDMLYYNSIGYNLVVRDADGKDVTDSKNANQSLNSVNYAVTAEDRDLYADRYGYSYFAALEIVPDEDMDRIPAGYSLEVTPYVTIGEDDAVLNGEKVIINVTDTSYEFAN